VNWAGAGLGDLACGVIRQLDLQNEAFDIVLSGSFFKGSDRLQQLIDDTVSGVAPRARTKRLEALPVMGGVLLAMEGNGIATPEKSPEIRHSLHQSSLAFAERKAGPDRPS
jgi:hypothetical protein